MDIEVSFTEVPQKAERENPFTGIIGAVVAESEKAGHPVAVTFNLHENDYAKRIKLAREAARDAGYTLRHTVSDPDKKGAVTVTAWLVEKIERKGKGE